MAGKQQASTAAPGTGDSGQIQSENKQQEIAIGPTATVATTTTKKPTPSKGPFIYDINKMFRFSSYAKVTLG